MPIVDVEGQQFEFPEGTSDEVIGQSIRQHFATQPPAQIAPIEPPTQPQRPVGAPAQAVIEPAATIITGAIAEPIAGLVGLATAPFQGAERATENIRAVQEALTFVPRTETGHRALQRVAEALQPVTEAVEAGEEAAGEVGFEAAGPIGGAIGETLPTAALTAVGLPAVRRVLGITKVAEVNKKLVTPSAKNFLKEATPTIEGLKGAAREVYKEIDDTGAVINSSSVDRLSTGLQKLAREEGFNKRIHPKVSAALDEFQNVKGVDQSVTNLDTLRKITKAAADSIEPSEKRLGTLLINRIDDFLDNAKPTDFAKGKGAEVGAKFRDARQLWQRAKKSELLENAFEQASLQATGFENGLRVQFRSILRNKKKLKGFTPDEIDAMKLVVKGGTAENIAKAIGRFGFSEGQATNMLMGSLGVAGGAAVGGPAGAVAVPLIGQVSRGLAQKLTRRNAELSDLIVRAGSNGRALVDAYLKSTVKAERNPAELSELLLRPEVNLKALKAKIPSLPKPQRKIVGDAVFFASIIQSQKEE